MYWYKINQLVYIIKHSKKIKRGIRDQRDGLHGIREQTMVGENDKKHYGQWKSQNR